MAYEKKYRQRVLEYLEAGHTQQATTETLGVGTATIKKWKKLGVTRKKKIAVYKERDEEQRETFRKTVALIPKKP